MRTVFDPYWESDTRLDQARLCPLFNRPHPFAIHGPLDAAVVRLLEHRQAESNLPFNDWRRLWLAGNRLDALKEAGRAGRVATRRMLGNALRSIPVRHMQ